MIPEEDLSRYARVFVSAHAHEVNAALSVLRDYEIPFLLVAGDDLVPWQLPAQPGAHYSVHVNVLVPQVYASQAIERLTVLPFPSADAQPQVTQPAAYARLHRILVISGLVVFVYTVGGIVFDFTIDGSWLIKGIRSILPP